MNELEKLTRIIMNPETPAKVIAALSEAIDMMNQGKSNEEIYEHFGIST